VKPIATTGISRC